MNRHFLFFIFISPLLLLGACGRISPERPDFPLHAVTSPALQANNSIDTSVREASPTSAATESPLSPTAIPTEIQTTFTPNPPTETFTLRAVSSTPEGLDLSPTPTSDATFIAYVPTPTETLLPPLELPTEQPHAPALVPWTGQPSYPGDSDTGLLFRVDYDPDLWAQTEGNYGDIVLGNRRLEYCTITPWTGRGLPVDWKVVHEFRYIGSASFDVNTITTQDIIKFVTYTGGDGHILSGFQVSFQDKRDQCLLEAEAIFGTLRSYAAVPTATPTP
ncbi:MAG: hypothetical protein WCK35_06110 [Chloroflexota bacterium]